MWLDQFLISINIIIKMYGKYDLSGFVDSGYVVLYT